MKIISFNIIIDKNINKIFHFDRLYRIPIKGDKILASIDFFNNKDIYNNFIRNGGEERYYKVETYEEFNSGVQRNRVIIS